MKRSLLLGSLLAVWPLAHAHAQGGGVRSAAEDYDAGTKAYRNKQYAEAARSFEAAYANAPNAEALRAAIVARQKSKQLARAATLAALGEKAHPDDAELGKVAADALKSKASLGAFVVHCTPACSLSVDGQLASVVDSTDTTLFLDPGPHKIAVEWGKGSSRSFDVEAKPGSEQREQAEKPAVEPPPPATPATPAPPPQSTVVSPPPPPEPSRKPLPKAVFFIAAGVTVAAGAATVVSGVLTLNDPGKEAVRRDCVGLGTECETYRAGQRAELRTNILLGATIGLAALTTASLFFTDFSGKSRGKARLAPTVDPLGRAGGLSLSGRF